VRPHIFLRRCNTENEGGGAVRGFDLDSSCSSGGEEGGSLNLHQKLSSSPTFEKQKRNDIAPLGSIPASCSSSAPLDI
jgi:hypothetical protein